MLKCEIFDHLDFHYLYTIVTLWLKYKLIICIFGGDRHHLLSSAHTEHTYEFLMRMLRAVLRIRIRTHRIHMFLGLRDPDLDPLVRDMDPDPSIIMQK